DLPLRAVLREQVLDLHRRLGTTLVHVTHDQAEALLMGDRVAVLNHGCLLQCGTPRDVYDRPAHRFVATFVGSPPMNLLPCQILSQGQTIEIQPLGTERTLRWPASGDSLPRGWAEATRLYDLGLRPEAIAVCNGGASPIPDQSAARLNALVRGV